MQHLLLLAALIMSLVGGFAMLALSQERNWRLVSHAPPPRLLAKVIFRAAGFGLLALALQLALWRDGNGFGALLWGTLISLSAFAVVMLLSLRRTD